MHVELRLYASLQKFLPGDSVDNPRLVEMEEGTTVRNLLEKFQIPFEAPKIIFLNGIHARGDEVLKDGDRVDVYEMLGGG